MKILNSFSELIQEFHEDPDRKAWIERYENKYGIDRYTPLQDHPFYKEYLCKFDPLFAMTRETINGAYAHVPHHHDPSCRGMNLLFRLIFGSLATDYNLSLCDNWREDPKYAIQASLTIIVEQEGEPDIIQGLEKMEVSKIRNLFRSYLKEQIEYYLIDDPESLLDLHIRQAERLRIYEERSNFVIFDLIESYKTLLELYLKS